mmetsp:Transcript_48221/g.127696  ORF Transcript_48221/g.127696 Transcript_48221/m.127696 type:complete len:84 (-) Transcript_48221:1712-1963(-)
MVLYDGADANPDVSGNVEATLVGFLEQRCLSFNEEGNTGANGCYWTEDAAVGGCEANETHRLWLVRSWSCDTRVHYPQHESVT